MKDAVEQYVLQRFVGSAAEQNIYNDEQISGLIDSLSNKMLTVSEVERLRTLLMNSEYSLLYTIYIQVCRLSQRNIRNNE